MRGTLGEGPGDVGIRNIPLTGGLDEARAQIGALGDAGVSLDAITSDLLAAGVKAFADSYESLLGRIDVKLQALRV